MQRLVADPGSFRDPSGRVLRSGDRIVRTISLRAASHYEAVRDGGVLRKFVENGVLVESVSLDPAELGISDPSISYVVEHPPIPFVSYPYEWPFALLKKAALFHLDLQLDLLADGFVLSDATAYNVQFRNGVEPLFIDLLSIRAYREGEYWLAHNQFCEQFLNPLLLRACFGIPHNDWFRGRLEGIPSRAISKMLPVHRKLSLRMIGHVVGPAHAQARSERKRAAEIVRRPLPKAAYRALLKQLRDWISSLKSDSSETPWQQYEQFHTYSEAEDEAKKAFVARFVGDANPNVLWDFGCNTGAHSEIAARAGVPTVIGFDYDHGALDAAVARAEGRSLRVLPLYLDGANPSPSQGWAQQERRGLADRVNADCLLALAFVHHLAIGRNVPLDAAVDWLIGFAPRGLIEFVQKDDSTVREMLVLREDVFHEYNESVFRKAIEARARIVAERRNPDNGRLLTIYERD